MTGPARAGGNILRALAFAFITMIAAGCGQQAGVAQVTGATYRPPLGSGSVGVAYLTIESPTADRVVEVTSPLAPSVEIHSTVFEGAMASMRPVASVDLPANIPVKFIAGGLHLMVIEPQGVESRETFPLTIRLESGQMLNVDCEIEGQSARGG